MGHGAACSSSGASAHFEQPLRQWQQAHEVERASRGDPNLPRVMVMQRLQQRHRQENLDGRQLLACDAAGSRRAVHSGGVGGPRPQPRDIKRFERERAAQALRLGEGPAESDGKVT
ncbi:MAG: hypothetical protein M5U08_25985 [Burkholderiales bacterium]|nr:hypothetical protein [Burkholderiales bacterium]